MTNLTRPVSRVSRGEVFEAGKRRKVIITLEPPYILKFRAQGCRKSYSLTTDACYTMAVKASVLAAKRSKKKIKGKI